MTPPRQDPPRFNYSRLCACDDGGTPIEDPSQKDVVCLKCGKPHKEGRKRRAP